MLMMSVVIAYDKDTRVVNPTTLWRDPLARVPLSDLQPLEHFIQKSIETYITVYRHQIRLSQTTMEIKYLGSGIDFAT